MKLELFDTYHIRVRLSASIIVLAPLAITLPPNCAEADLPKKSSVQKLCSTVSHAR